MKPIPFLALTVVILLLSSILVAAQLEDFPEPELLGSNGPGADAGSDDDSGETGDEDEEVEQEIGELETTTEEEEEEVLEELEELVEATNDDLEEEAGVDEELAGEIERVRQGIGMNNFIHNLQLSKRGEIALIGMDVIIAHVEETGGDASELSAIKEELSTSLSDFDPEAFTGEELAEKIGQIKDIVKRFHDAAKALVDEADVEGLRQEIKDAVKDADLKIGELVRKETAVRKLHNLQQKRDALKKIQQEAKRIHAATGRILQLTERLRGLKNLDVGGEGLTTEGLKSLKEEWKEKVEGFKEERQATAIKASRLKVLKETQEFHQSLRRAEKEGQDVAEAKAAYAEMKSELKSTRAEAKGAAPRPLTATVKQVRERLKEVKESLPEPTEEQRQAARARIAAAQQEARTLRGLAAPRGTTADIVPAGPIRPRARVSGSGAPTAQATDDGEVA
ncbi:MAG: hypothetical protein ABIC95_07180 [archaeon]